MRRIGIWALIFVLTAVLVFAAGQGSGGQGVQKEDTIEPGQGENQAVQTDTGTQTQQQNQGEEAQIQNQVQTQSRIQSGSYTTENGEQIYIQEQSNNRVQLKSGEVTAQTSLEMTQEQTQNKTQLHVKLSNGKNAEVKVMPDTASERALEVLRLKVCSEENACQIELKEVGQGEQVRAAYEFQAQKQAKVLGLFKTKMQVQTQIDAENGEVIQTKNPWWAFLASESEE